MFAFIYYKRRKEKEKKDEKYLKRLDGLNGIYIKELKRYVLLVFCKFSLFVCIHSDSFIVLRADGRGQKQRNEIRKKQDVP